jgi:hypothetical protein
MKVCRSSPDSYRMNRASDYGSEEQVTSFKIGIFYRPRSSIE